MLSPLPLLGKGLGIGACLLLASCRGPEVMFPTEQSQSSWRGTKGALYVLCEGNMGSNKAQLDMLDIPHGNYIRNCYGAQNPHVVRDLGDVGNDIAVYGGKLYAVINCSHKLEVLDLSAHRIGQVDLPNCRNIVFSEGYAYVSAYVGSIADANMQGSVYKVDTASLQVVAECKVGLQPDNMLISHDTLYVLNTAGYVHGDSTISIVSLSTFTELERLPYTLRQPSTLFIPDTRHVLYRGVRYDLEDWKTAEMRTPYSLYVTDDYVFVCDATNYVSSGMLYVFSHDHTLLATYRTGDIPGHMVYLPFVPEMDNIVGPSLKDDTLEVVEFLPAIGQFVNELPLYEEGDDMRRMCSKCAHILNTGDGLISLGGWGGRIVVKLPHEVTTFRIFGNAFILNGQTEYGSSEPGIVQVSADGMNWTEIRGAAHDDTKTKTNYSRTYSKDQDKNHNPYHQQPYFPLWVPQDTTYSFEGTCLPTTRTNIGGQFVQRILGPGYVDDLPNTDIEGNTYRVDSPIRYIRIYTAVYGTFPITGELSTEIERIEF